VTELLAAARVALSAVAPRGVRVRTTAGPVAPAKRFSYVVGRPDPGSWSVDEGPNRVTLRTTHLVVEATLDPWQLVFRTPDGRLLTHQVHDDANFAGQRFGPRPGFEVESLPHDPARRVRGVVETLLLDPEDHFYGSGERFGRLDLVGRTVRIWNRNPYGARSELAYKNLPVVVGSRGYGLFVDVPTTVGFHLGSLSNRAYTVQAEGEELDYYLMAGTPKEIVTAYTGLTGRPAVPPEWAFGLWASTCFVQFTEASVLEVARRLRAAYLEYTRQEIEYYTNLHRQIFGHEIPHVMLLHANRLNADTIEQILKLFEQMKYRFVTLAEAQSDKAYQTPDTYITAYGPMWGYRWARDLNVKVDGRLEKEPPAWVTEYK